MTSYAKKPTHSFLINDMAVEFLEHRRVENEHAKIWERIPDLALERRARKARVDRRRKKLLAEPAVRQKWDNMRAVFGDDFDELKFWQGLASENT